MNSGKSGPYQGDSIICLAHPRPQEAMSEDKPAFILFYKNGVCCTIFTVKSSIGSREEAHMDFSSILMKYDIDIEEYDTPEWGWPW